MLNAIQAFMRHESQPSSKDLSQAHVDPFNIAASYLAATTATVPYSVDIIVVKRGRGFTNLEARIVQKVSSKTQVIMQPCLLFLAITLRSSLICMIYLYFFHYNSLTKTILLRSESQLTF